MSSDKDVLRRELKTDLDQESRLLLKELLVILTLLVLTWFRQTYLHGWFA